MLRSECQLIIYYIHTQGESFIVNRFLQVSSKLFVISTNDLNGSFMISGGEIIWCNRNITFPVFVVTFLTTFYYHSLIMFHFQYMQ